MVGLTRWVVEFDVLVSGEIGSELSVPLRATTRLPSPPSPNNHQAKHSITRARLGSFSAVPRCSILLVLTRPARLDASFVA